MSGGSVMATITSQRSRVRRRRARFRKNIVKSTARRHAVYFPKSVLPTRISRAPYQRDSAGKRSPDYHRITG